MEWERVGEETFWAEDDGTWGPRILAHLKPAKRYRITLEEETRKCCERWRGKLAVACDKIIAEECHPTIVLGDIHVQSSPPAKFCPECGKKL